jgi:hypothetical protein
MTLSRLHARLRHPRRDHPQAPAPDGQNARAPYRNGDNGAPEPSRNGGKRWRTGLESAHQPRPVSRPLY